MEKKQSSIDKFVQKLKRKGLLITEDSEYIVAYLEAKAMHKEEIVNAYEQGDKYKLNFSGEHWYNETFGGEDEN